MKRDMAEGDGSGPVLIQDEHTIENFTRAHTGSDHFTGTRPNYSSLPARTNQHKPKAHKNAAPGKPPTLNLPTEGRRMQQNKQCRAQAAGRRNHADPDENV